MDDNALRFVDNLSEAQLGDLEKLYRNEWWTKARGPEDTRRIVAGSTHVFGFVDAADALVAFARVLSDGAAKAFVFDVIVAPEYRDRALGRALMERILAHEGLKAVEHLELYCLPELVPFYRRFGFSDEVGGVLLMRRQT